MHTNVSIRLLPIVTVYLVVVVLVGCAAPDGSVPGRAADVSVGSASTGTPTEHLPPPLVDGDCGEYELLEASTQTLAPGVVLRVYQDRHYVWLCYGYPEGSFGTVDLRVEAPGLPEPLNLHVSAQIGEWPADQPDAAPQDPESDSWWNAQGWTANAVWINGMDRSRDPVRYRFDNAPARELQLAKSRFGRGTWHLHFEIRAIRTGAMLETVRFPEAEGETWPLAVD